MSKVILFFPSEVRGGENPPGLSDAKSIVLPSADINGVSSFESEFISKIG